MSNEINKTNELSEQELEKIDAGAAGNQLLGHELTHIQQQSGSRYIGETEKNLSLKVESKRSINQGRSIVVQSGDGSI